MRLGVISTVCLFVTVVEPATGQTTRFYDQNGNYRGRQSEQNGTVRNFDRNGNQRGYSKQEDNRTVYYDNNGNRRGYATGK